MKTLMIAAALMGLGAGVACAQGLPPGFDTSAYGVHEFRGDPYHTGTMFSGLFNGSRPVAEKSSRNASPATKTDKGS
jgi:hypothetical protein